MKNLKILLLLSITFTLSNCTNELSQTNGLTQAQVAFMKGEHTGNTHVSYILEGKKHHPFLFRDQLEVVKDKTVSIEKKSELVYQTIKNHVEVNGITEADKLDVQKLILFLYGDYAIINRTISKIEDKQNEYFLNTLIAYQAIDFKYLATVSKHLKAQESYVLTNSKEYKVKYEGIIAERGLTQESGYGAHCYNIVESCTKAIALLQDS
ncbi:MAG: hypothetical protein P1U56_08280 [Saprospiraceae bacterium]|nr:hypothetical protein [Saprospiraceae bacterium]